MAKSALGECLPLTFLTIFLKTWLRGTKLERLQTNSNHQLTSSDVSPVCETDGPYLQHITQA
ncbi:hypothetical protein E4U55_003450 [Claviceps digitariae]|nr:hypothetical protein E4U55_003450 [Claviceps digitariae]